MQTKPIKQKEINLKYFIGMWSNPKNTCISKKPLSIPQLVLGVPWCKAQNTNIQIHLNDTD